MAYNPYARGAATSSATPHPASALNAASTPPVNFVPLYNAQPLHAAPVADSLGQHQQQPIQAQHQQTSPYAVAQAQAHGYGQPAQPSMQNVTQGMHNLRMNEKIDAAAIPIVVGKENFIREHNTEINTVPPPPNSRFYVIDGGNCSPRFMRMSMYSVACSGDMQNEVGLPLGVVIQPLAQLHPVEAKVPLIDFGTSGPMRCGRCRAYINPFVSFVEAGRKYTCSLCAFPNEVPTEYFCPLDGYGRRVDVMQRPELSKGSIDYAASSEFFFREALPQALMFVIDVSLLAITSGFLKTCVQSIIEILDALPPSETSRVGFITYDSAIQFYNVLPSLRQPQMLVMGDVTDVFVPLEDTVLVDYRVSRSLIQPLLEKLTQLFPAQAAPSAPALGSALEAAAKVLEGSGGKILAFVSSLSQTGNGPLKMRIEKVGDTDKDSAFLRPQNTYYTELGNHCASKGVGVHLFTLSETYVDVATIGEVSRISGGQVYQYGSFASQAEQYRFHCDLNRNLTREQGYDGILRVRCSTGIAVKAYYGNIRSDSNPEVGLAVVDSDKSLAVTFQHEEKLPENKTIVVQMALLYTTSAGLRRIRVHTLAVSATSNAASLYKSIDVYTLVHFLARNGLTEGLKSTLQQGSTAMLGEVTAPLLAYRKLASSNTGTGQLILPDSLRLLPLLALSVLKSVLFLSGVGITTDTRAVRIMQFNSTSLAKTWSFLHPYMTSMHTLPADAGQETAGEVVLPPGLQLGVASLTQAGIYLLDDGYDTLVFVGRSASPQQFATLFPVQTTDITNPIASEVEGASDESRRVCKVINALHGYTGEKRPLQVVQQGDPATEWRVFMRLIEDKIVNQPTYADFLCMLHRHIQQKISGHN